MPKHVVTKRCIEVKISINHVSPDQQDICSILNLKGSVARSTRKCTYGMNGLKQDLKSNFIKKDLIFKLSFLSLITCIMFDIVYVNVIEINMFKLKRPISFR